MTYRASYAYFTGTTYSPTGHCACGASVQIDKIEAHAGNIPVCPRCYAGGTG